MQEGNNIPINLYSFLPSPFMYDKFIFSLKKYLLSTVTVLVRSPEGTAPPAAPSHSGRRSTVHAQIGVLRVSEGAVGGAAGAHAQKDPTRSEGFSEEVET